MVNTTEPAAQQAPQAREVPWEGPPEAPAWVARPHTAAAKRPPAAALGLALAAHATLLLALVREPADPLAGNMGHQLDAISVTLVSSNVIESLQIDQPPTLLPAAPRPLETNDGDGRDALAQKKAERQERAEKEPARPVEAMAELPSELSHKEERIEQTAAGGAAARTDAAGTAQSSAPATASAGAVREYASHVAQALAKAKPKSVGAYGTVKVKLLVATDGSIALVEIIRSSGNKRLDDAAFAAVQRVKLPAPPPGLSHNQRWYEFPYYFR
jgi:protein TonB